ncbi:MAG: helix-turn-helix domain-containing protein, partial [Actinomycetia bacterium]|nr:helix-turn-helix domain-containing protein [Actinomycetes bacterium]
MSRAEGEWRDTGAGTARAADAGDEPGGIGGPGGIGEPNRGEPDPGARNSTVDRALRVLEAFLVDEPQLGVVELSRQLDLDKSVIHRILATLVRRRFIEQDPVSRRYQIGLRVWELGQRYRAGHQLRDLAEKELM